MKRFSTAGTMKIPPPHQVINSSKTSHRFQPAFTLVELLVVIAIVAILAALLFPLVGSMRIKASSAVSVSNLRNIGIAIVSYAADNNGTLPGPTYAHLNPRYQDTGNWLPYYLRDYLPYVKQPQNSIPNTRYSPAFDYPAARSQGQNPLISSAGQTYTVYSRVRDSEGSFLPLGYPGTAPPMTTAGLAARDTRYRSGLGKKPWITERTNSAVNQPLPHGKYANTLMFDYSVKAIPTNELIDPNIW
ncbi:MAG: type II secretion system protein [Proteobacteria bacterium]|nr:type II secretion system protein [Pseudomonadota bacterium]